jgi:WD40 repeat protein
MAQQEEPVRRKVALKIIKFGMDTRQVIARFEAERQALAMMDHPNIARVFDAGATESGRPYFVMELVQGIRITDYSDLNHLSTEERLQLFIQVCHAIRHAHQKGIIHRDIKPSNVLITLCDGVAVPKVIDFGIAKAVQQPLTDKTLFTQFQTFIGTPAYTSPEQAEMSSLDVDTRSDIYSLGVLLYELLTGQTPFDPNQLRQANLDEMRRMIREQEPVKPSTRISTFGMADATVLTAARRARMPALTQAFRGDLDWIVMKCLEKDRSRRYETVDALALDVQRYLDSEPVLARRPSTAYRIGKFVRRNKVMVGATAAVALALSLGLVVSTWQAIRATQAEQEQRRLHRAVDAAFKTEARLRQKAQSERIAALRRAYNSDMNLVQQALSANNYGRVVDLLNRYWPEAESVPRPARAAISPDFRQWEWRYFWAQSRSEAKFVLPQQAGAVSILAMSPNGRLLASGHHDGRLTLWDLATQSEVAVIQERAPGTGPIVFSHDGSRLAVAFNHGPDGSAVRIWTPARRQFGEEFLQPDRLEAVAFSPDDTELITYSQGGVVRAWNLETRQLARQVHGPPVVAWGQRVRFSPDAHWIGLVDRKHIYVVDAETGEQRSSAELQENEFNSLAFSPDGELLAAGPSFAVASTTIRLFSTSTGKEVGQFVGHVSWVPDLVFTADGQRLISAGADQTLRIWDVASRQEVTSLRGHLSEIYCLAVSSDGKTAVSGCKDGTLFGWDCERTAPKARFETLPVPVASIDFFKDGQRILSVNQNHTVSVWDPATLQETEQLDVLGNHVEHILISPDGSRVYASSWGGTITVLDWATRLVVTNLVTGAEPLPPFAGGREGTLLGLLDQGRTLLVQAPGPAYRFLDTSSWVCTSEWKLDPGPAHFQLSRLGPLLSPDRRFLVFAVDDGLAEFRNTMDGHSEGTVALQRGRPTAMAFSPDCTLFATSSSDGTVNLWDCSQRKLVDVLRGHLLGIEAISFSPDGQRLASTSHGSEAVKLWDVQTRHEVATLAGEGSLFRRVQFSPDGRWLVAINLQGQAHFWRAPSLEEIGPSPLPKR